jgi:hypothetical protein
MAAFMGHSVSRGRGQKLMPAEDVFDNDGMQSGIWS